MIDSASNLQYWLSSKSTKRKSYGITVRPRSNTMNQILRKNAKFLRKNAKFLRKITKILKKL